MAKRLLAMGMLLAVCAALLGGVAGAATVRVGTLVLHADGGFAPRLLPKRSFAPIRFQGYGDVNTTDGSLPPALNHVKVDFDRDGRLTTTGLPTCAPADVEAASPGEARRRCRDAIVGVGSIGAAVPMPDVGRIQMNSPLTIFNGPRQGGNPTVVLHAQAPAPISETYVVLIPIERRSGAYRYRAEFDVPSIAAGTGALTHIDAKIGRRWRSGGGERSYVSARCSDYILQTKGYFSFADGNVIYGSVFKACRPKP
ncbi:MAG TPA: hypothetical protein VIS95_03995 [Solirubrobacterales bacterium]